MNGDLPPGRTFSFAAGWVITECCETGSGRSGVEDADLYFSGEDGLVPVTLL